MGFILIIYFFALVLIAWQSAAQVKSVSDFFVARKGGSVLMITGSLLATILGGSAVIGAIDAGPRLGGASTWFLLTGAIGLLALLPFLPRICKLGRFTLPDLMEDLYGKGPRTVASIIIPVAWTGVVAAQIIASGKILQSFTGMNYMAGAIVSGIIFIGYTLAGGQFSVLRTDFLQASLIILGIILLTVFAYLHPIVYMGIPALTFPFNENFSVLDLVLLLLTYATAYTAGPDMYSRLFCAKDEKTAQRSVVIAAMILSLMAACIGFLSSYGAALNFTSGARIIEIGRVVLPNFLLPVLGLCLLSVVLSSADTTLLSSSIIITRLCTRSPVSDAVEIRRTRLVILLNGIVALVIAINFTDIIGMMLLALAVYAGAFTLPILLGLVGVRVKTPFISAAIIFGGVLALLGKLMPPSMGAHTGDVFLVLAFIVNGILMLLGRIKLSDQKL